METYIGGFSVIKPYFKFYSRDWQANTELQSCSLAAKGLWIEMLCIMAQAERCGYLEQKDKPVTIEALSRLVRASSVEECTKLLEELKWADVFSVCDKTGSIYSRRMVSDHAKYVKAIEDGSAGGNPMLLKLDNPENTEGRSQKAEATEGLTGGVKGVSRDSEFNTFWMYYPRKDSKADARKAWCQMSNFIPSLSELIPIITRQISENEWTRDRIRYIPLPATWLRAYRWTDEPKPNNPLDRPPRANERSAYANGDLPLEEERRRQKGMGGLL